MEGGCSSPPSEASGATVEFGGSGASKFLTNLPSRGLFSSTVLSSNPGGLRVYVCDHDTSPPADQLIKTNQKNILIRSLMLKNPKCDSSSKDGKGSASNQNSKKRAAEKTLDKAAGKKAMSSTQLGSSQAYRSQVHHESFSLDRPRWLTIGSTRTWQNRVHYSNIWWKPNTTRGSCSSKLGSALSVKRLAMSGGVC